MPQNLIRNAAIGVVAAAAVAAPVALPTALAAPAGSSSEAGTPTVQTGSHGQPVKDLQQLLNSKSGSNLAVDGDFGSQTKAAVVSFQKSKNLTADGVVGPQTWQALGRTGGGTTTAAGAGNTASGGHDTIDGNDCFAHDPGQGLTARQKENARTIIGVAKGAGFNQRGQAVALATAMQESKLCNLSFGDRDSLGLFQQRPGVGWGSQAEINNTVKSSKAFFGVADHTDNPGLKDVSGWENMSINDAAQAVQRSGVPDGYRKWEGLAQQTVKQNADAPTLK